jgi:hypothetical protein
MMELAKLICGARKEISPEGETGLVWPNIKELAAYLDDEMATARDLIRASGLTDALRQSGSPQVPPSEIEEREKQFRRLVRNMSGHTPLTERESRFLGTVLARWENIARARAAELFA